MMERKQAIELFFETLGLEQTGVPVRFHDYLKEALIQFSGSESKYAAGRVYDVFAEINRRADSERRPLVSLMDVMRAYEEGASTLTENHRDHFVHSVNVFLLGLQIYANNGRFREAFLDYGSSGTFCNEYERFLYAWGHASLFHDIGYPVEIASNQIKMFIKAVEGGASPEDAGRIGPSVYIHGMDVLSRLSGCREGADSMALVSDRISEALGLDADAVYDTVKGLNRAMCSGRFVDHGFYSMLIFIRSMSASMEASEFDERRFDGEVVDAAASILLHNLYRGVFADGLGPMRLRSFPLAYLLILCDELQDWNREKYGIRTRAAVYPDSGRITFKDGMITVNYRTADLEVGEGYVRDKLSLLRRLLDLDDLCSDIRITCSCDRSADLLLEGIRGAEHGPVPYPMIGDIERVAEAIHADYNRNRLIEHPGEPLEYPDWSDLPQDLKFSNMMQAMDIPRKLRAIGCRIEDDDGSGLVSFSPEEVEALAVMEHDRWVEERSSNGWVWGPEKDVGRRVSPYIAGWDEIPEAIREYDAEAVRNIIPLLGSAGLMVVRNDRRPCDRRCVGCAPVHLGDRACRP